MNIPRLVNPASAQRLNTDATSALLSEMAHMGQVYISAGKGRFGGGPDEWNASLTIQTPGAGELRFTNSGTATTPLAALNNLKERVDEYMNHELRR